MSTLTCFAGVDTHGISSVYIATDSRGTSDNGYWDCCQKSYASLARPIILGYVGDVLYSSQIAPRLLQLGELLYSEQSQFGDLVSHLEETCRSALSGKNRTFSLKTEFDVVIACRYGKRSFFVASLKVRNSQVMSVFHDLPSHSGIILSLGTGGENVQKQVAQWKKTPGENTSRAIFIAHCDSLLSEEKTLRSLDPKTGSKDYKRDQFSGGAPQLTGLYNIGNGIIHGIVWKGKNYINAIPGNFALAELQWRDRKFQRCDPQTRRLLEGAKKQVNEARAKRLS